MAYASGVHRMRTPLLPSWLLLLLLAQACTSERVEPQTVAEPVSRDAQVHPKLKDHTRLTEKKVYHPAPNVHVAVGFGLANSIMVEGADGIIIIDTMESRSEAEAVLAEFRKITDKPVKAIIYTHNHADHVFGGRVFDESGDVPVYAHRTTSMYIDRIVNVLKDTIYTRSMRMFGAFLSDAEFENNGIGPRLTFKTEQMALKRPTHVFDDQLDLTVAGVKLQLFHAPGETDDQLFVWLPELKVLMPGDNVYQAFPNLYTIRGTKYRDVRQWVDSIDRMRDLKPEILVPSHLVPVTGAQEIDNILTAYRDAIQFVHDQTIRGINRGYAPDELVQRVKLPSQLRNHPWLLEHYGAVSWSVRSIFTGYLGWFDGRAASLEPLSAAERGERLLKAFTLGQPLPEQARQAFTNGDLQWAAELAEAWRAAEPNNAEPRLLLADVLAQKARAHINPNARHYYYTQAQELRAKLKITPSNPSATPNEFLNELPIDVFMKAMSVRAAGGRRARQEYRRPLHLHRRRSNVRGSHPKRYRRSARAFGRRGHVGDRDDRTHLATDRHQEAQPRNGVRRRRPQGRRRHHLGRPVFGLIRRRLWRAQVHRIRAPFHRNREHEASALPRHRIDFNRAAHRLARVTDRRHTHAPT